MMFAQTPTAIDYWMIVAIGLILVVLIFLSLAEMSLSQMTKPRAAALAEKGAKSGKALVRLAAEPTLWVNPLLLTVNRCGSLVWSSRSCNRRRHQRVVVLCSR
jgi:CBS domain containing-hemolysin-like protein